MTAVMAINAAKAATFIAIRTDKIHLGGFQCAGSRSDFMSSSSALSKFVMLYLLSILSMIKERMEPIYRLFGERLVSYAEGLGKSPSQIRRIYEHDGRRDGAIQVKEIDPLLQDVGDQVRQAVLHLPAFLPHG